MVFPNKLLAGVSFAVCIMLPAPVLSDVKIILNNGRSITAESCQEKAGELVCSRGGGFFTIDKDNVSEMEKIREGRAASGGEMSTGEPSGESVSGKAGAAEEDGRPDVASPRKDLENKLTEIRKRKSELQEERARLLKTRQQLKTDMDKAPDWMTEKQYNELSGRASDLDKRIKKFNDEVSRLNTEEKDIIERLEGKPKQTGKRPEGTDF
ncbi:MAG: hypothetical protein P8013_09460 [Candidatus Sulfobium sp.]|jgi:uncharacterized protein (DUF3084 family)